VESYINILIAILSTTTLTTIINNLLNRRKLKAEATRAEQNIVGDRVDQANKIVTMATNFLEDIEEERQKLRVEKQKLENINKQLLSEIETLKLNIRNLTPKENNE
jgi:lysyl-tRNA synthetase class I